MESLEAALREARELDVESIASAIQRIGFECTRCGDCCRSVGGDQHTATIFPAEIRDVAERTGLQWGDVARPMPFGLEGGRDVTFEWALQTDESGNCRFLQERAESGAELEPGEGDGGEGGKGGGGEGGKGGGEVGGKGGGGEGGKGGGGEGGEAESTGCCGEGENGGSACIIYGDRPLICRTYPFSLDLGGMTEPDEAIVATDGRVQAHECRGLGRSIDREEAMSLARMLKRRAIRELTEAIRVAARYEPVSSDGEIVVHDSEGAKRPDGTPL
ncbi:MAG: YkgJ family cysteine cluster protein [Halodesulfurarchaeum sp.]